VPDQYFNIYSKYRAIKEQATPSAYKDAYARLLDSGDNGIGQISSVVDAVLHPYSDFIMHLCKNPLNTPYPGG